MQTSRMKASLLQKISRLMEGSGVGTRWVRRWISIRPRTCAPTQLQKTEMISLFDICPRHLALVKIEMSCNVLKPPCPLLSQDNEASTAGSDRLEESRCGY